MRLRLVFLIVVLLVSGLLTSVFLFSYYKPRLEKPKAQCYIGVIYCGDTTTGAKLLIDRVKTYTNLFVLSNIPVTSDEIALTEVCEYAVSADLSIIVNLGTAGELNFTNYTFSPWWTWQYQWLDMAKRLWGEKFLGVYYFDEPGGMHIDSQWKVNASANPFLSYEGTEKFFEWVLKNDSGLNSLKEKDIKAFTSDYVLYWFDYLAGYDVVLAELGLNQSFTQAIGLVRGAATVQNKEWGVTITWRYNGTPYLDSGDAIYRQLLTAYECGAEYELIFNYPTYPENNPYGVMTDEHFEALERFWNDVVASSPRTHGSIKAEAVLLLPKDYGWGMRNPRDRIWGAWGPDEKSAQIWSLSRSLLAHYDFGLDIIYEDNSFPIGEIYPKIYYWIDTYDDS